MKQIISHQIGFARRSRFSTWFAVTLPFGVGQIPSNPQIIYLLFCIVFAAQLARADIPTDDIKRSYTNALNYRADVNISLLKLDQKQQSIEKIISAQKRPGFYNAPRQRELQTIRESREQYLRAIATAEWEISKLEKQYPPLIGKPDLPPDYDSKPTLVAMKKPASEPDQIVPISSPAPTPKTSSKPEPDNITMGIMVIFLLGLYLLPCFIASRRHHRNELGICLLTIFGGWTGILWLAALIWSVYEDHPAKT